MKKEGRGCLDSDYLEHIKLMLGFVTRNCLKESVDLYISCSEKFIYKSNFDVARLSYLLRQGDSHDYPNNIERFLAMRKQNSDLKAGIVECKVNTAGIGFFKENQPVERSLEEEKEEGFFFTKQ